MLIMTLTFLPKPLNFGSHLQPPRHCWTAARDFRFAMSAIGSSHVFVRVCLCIGMYIGARTRCGGRVSCGGSGLYFESQRPEERTAAGQRNRSRSLTFIRPLLQSATRNAAALLLNSAVRRGLLCASGGATVPSPLNFVPLSQPESPLAPLCDYLGGCRSSIFRRESRRNSGSTAPAGDKRQSPSGLFHKKKKIRALQRATRAQGGLAGKPADAPLSNPYSPEHKRCLNCYYCCCYYRRTALGFCLQGTCVNLCRIQTPKHECFVQGSCFIFCITRMFCCSFAKACTHPALTSVACADRTLQSAPPSPCAGDTLQAVPPQHE